jgi:fatty-acyl-CoA synthase
MSTDAPQGLGDVLRARAADPATATRPWLRVENERLSFAEAYDGACRWANVLRGLRIPARPFHVGFLLENRLEFVLAQMGAALAGAVVVGLNPTRRGAPLARDVGHSDCGVVLTEEKFAPLLAEALATTTEPGPAVLVCERDVPARLAGASSLDPDAPVAAGDLCLLVFTSGTTDAPKAVRRSHGSLMMLGQGAAFLAMHLTADDVIYCAMPLFHGNAQILALAASLAAGCGLALAPRFSKTRFLADVRRHGATVFNYVGSPLAYVMDTPEQPDDADNPLRLAYGNEGPRQYLDAFARRFGCRVVDSYGASEVGISFTREDGDPPSALGRPTPGVAILDEHGRECPPARFDAAGRLANPEEAIGEIVNTSGTGFFEGYYKNDAATEARARGGRYHSGDLGYRDDAGYVYFAGRDAEWIRVDGENFLARPIETILQRHPGVFMAAAYGVPDAEAGDRVMAALALRSGSRFDGADFAAFLAAQPDLSPKWTPTFVRIVPELRRSETNKVLKRELQREKFLGVGGPDPLWWRPRGEATFRPFGAGDLAALRARFERAGNLARLDG